MFRFTIRDVLWLTVVVACLAAWLTDRWAQARRQAEANRECPGQSRKGRPRTSRCRRGRDATRRDCQTAPERRRNACKTARGGAKNAA